MSIPDQNIMTLTASSLRERNPDVTYLNGEVRRHIREIETQIRDAVRSKQTSIVYPIEQNFAVQKITNRSAQRFIYSAIYEQLKTNGFETTLHMTEREVRFEITWVTQMDRNEITRQMQLIDEARSKKF